MDARARLFAAVLLVAAGLVVAGVALWAAPAGFVAAGCLLAGWSWLVLGGDDDTPVPVVDVGELDT